MSENSKPSSSVRDAFEQDNKYKPVTNFEPQGRINPFDKGVHKTSAILQTPVGGGSTTSSTSSSSISSSSISSRINRNGNMKSPAPPTGPPPPPPPVAAAINSIMSSSYKSTTSYSISEVTKESKPSYGSSSSIESVTRMETTVTTDTTATAGATGGADTDTAEAVGPIADSQPNTNAKPHVEWKSNMGLRSASVYSAPATTSAALPADTSGYISNSGPPSNGYNSQQAEVPSYTRPSYSRSESNASKKSDLDIIFGDNKSLVYGNDKYTRSSGSLSDAELIFGGPSNYKTDRFGSSKSMSVTSDRQNSSTNNAAPYRIYEGIQNAGFSDYSDSPSKRTGSNSSVNSYTSSANRWSQPNEEDDELDLK